MEFDIGIIGGAGPQAGVLFVEKIIQLLQQDHGAWEADDFPSINLISFPFSNMLSGKHNATVIVEELESVVNELSARFISIACNTLHSFCGEWANQEGFVNIVQETAKRVHQEKEPPLVLCTTTSRNYKVHQKHFPCVYTPKSVQFEVDEIIRRILQGRHSIKTTESLSKIINKHTSGTQAAVLGCTELSLLMRDYPIADYPIIDPIMITAETLCHLLKPRVK